MASDQPKCPHCRGDGFYFRVPAGFNLFSAGALLTAAASRQEQCWECRGTGVAPEEHRGGIPFGGQSL